MDDLSDIIGLGEGDEGDDKTAFPGAMSASALLPGYAELHCLSNFSFLRGASHPQELAAAALEHGYIALAITDECSLAGVVRAHAAIKDIEAKARADAEAAQLAGVDCQLRWPPGRQLSWPVNGVSCRCSAGHSCRSFRCGVR